MFKRLLKYRFTGNPQVVLLIRLLFVLFLVTCTRLLLYTFNAPLFQGLTGKTIVYYAIAGIRFDVVITLAANALYIFLLSIPFRFRRSKLFRKISDTIFIFTNSILLLPNLADNAYFPFALKRLTADIFNYITTGDDTLNMMPQFLKDYWHLLLIWLLGIIIIIFISQRFRISHRYVMQKSTHYYFSQTISMILIFALTAIGIHGTLKPEPLHLSDAFHYARASETALVLNSGFTLLRSPLKPGVEQHVFFNDKAKLNSLFNPVKNYPQADSSGNKSEMDRKNVVVIILESISTEHIGALNKSEGNKDKDFTPFLNSLIHKSTVYKGFANGKRSIEAIPAVLASLPTWMTEAYITSKYSSNSINSLASTLKSKGYSTSFFHGGKNGTMGFDDFCKKAGFDTYYGRNEYPFKNDYDGFWGIWDEPYLQYVAKKLETVPQPFLSAVFTISSHHPYRVPANYKGKFRKGKLKIQQTILYSDYALSKFFAAASVMPWYKNTLFVITADHSSEADDNFYQTRTGQYSVPIIFFSPANETGITNNTIAQHTDIMPTILDFLHFPDPFIAFGSSLNRSNENHFSLSYLNGSYQLLYNGYSFQSNLMGNEELYNFETDSLLQTNLINKLPAHAVKSSELLKAVVQEYNNRLSANTLIIR